MDGDGCTPQTPTPSARQRSSLTLSHKRPDLQCTTCQRLFSKPEHLKARSTRRPSTCHPLTPTQRHEQSHAGVRLFRCRACGKKFSRQDSLKRHERAHASATHPSPRTSNASLGDDAGPDGEDSETLHPDADHIGLFALVQATASQDVRDSHVMSTTEQMNVDSTAGDVAVDHGTHHSTLADREAYATHGFNDGLPANSAPQTPWLECDDVFNMLLREDAMWPLDIQPAANDINTSLGFSDGNQEATSEDGSSSRAHQAMRHMSSLLQDLSFNLAREVESTGVTSEFLDTCVNTFFDCFVPIFPVSHQPTFSLKDCTHPALLNMIALGSLFVAAEDALDWGEALWRLAHAAVATSWQGMMNHLSHGDVTAGVQLVMTALLGQSYALLSRNRSSRLTSHIFHSLGFYWARQCGLPVTIPFTDVPSSHSPYEVKRRQWKTWAAQETRHRILLGHYILDGLISQSSGLPTSDRHMTNRMILPSSPVVYNATTVDAWLEAMQQHPQSALEFRDVYLQLFDPSTSFRTELSPFALSVVLEGFQSLISDHHEAGGQSIGVPDRTTISRVMWRLYDTQICSLPSHEHQLELAVRWHAISIELCVDSSQLTRNLCQAYSVQQGLYKGRGSRPQPLCIEDWIETRSARRALLHASAVLELVTNLPYGRLRAIHIPLAVFISAIVCLVPCLADQSRAPLPSDVDWKVVCEISLVQDDPLPLPQATSSTGMFLSLASNAWNSGAGMGTLRNLMYTVNSLQKVLESLSSTWGIAKEMGSILGQLLSACRTRVHSTRHAA